MYTQTKLSDKVECVAGIPCHHDEVEFVTL